MISPSFLLYVVLTGSVAVIAALLYGLSRTPLTDAWTKGRRTAALGAAAVILIGWFAAVAVLGYLGVFAARADRLPTIQFAILPALLIGAYLITRSGARIIAAIPQQWLVGVQVYRALGVIFLLLLAAGELPGLFAWPAGLGDVIVGVLAPVVAIAYARAPRRNGDLVAAWNALGLADLAVALTTGFLTSPSSLRLFSDAPNELVTRFPLVLIPAFLVPLSVLLHLASLSKLRGTLAQNERQETVSSTI